MGAQRRQCLEPLAAVGGLALTRPAAAQRIRTALRDTDTGAVALALVGTVHHLLMTGWAGVPDPRGQAERLVTMLVGPGGAAAGGPG
ncbi:hypothetical protein [Streptomyces noursei]|uniref:hypothetical protein n=1 Tax=Streptomyces noursei TaxID=1971 RepID=UPI00034036C6|nr:hypothetical protein K530_23858 [Streptomyces noursei CCRC 11814]